MFIDTSVIVAILSREPDAAALADQIEAASACCTSALVVLEASMRLSTKLGIDPVAVEKRIWALIDEAGITLAQWMRIPPIWLCKPLRITAKAAGIPRN